MGFLGGIARIGRGVGKLARAGTRLVAKTGRAMYRKAQKAVRFVGRKGDAALGAADTVGIVDGPDWIPVPQRDFKDAWKAEFPEADAKSAEDAWKRYEDHRMALEEERTKARKQRDIEHERVRSFRWAMDRMTGADLFDEDEEGREYHLLRASDSALEEYSRDFNIPMFGVYLLKKEAQSRAKRRAALRARRAKDRQKIGAWLVAGGLLGLGSCGAMYGLSAGSTTTQMATGSPSTSEVSVEVEGEAVRPEDQTAPSPVADSPQLDDPVSDADVPTDAPATPDNPNAEGPNANPPSGSPTPSPTTSEVGITPSSPDDPVTPESTDKDSPGETTTVGPDVTTTVEGTTTIDATTTAEAATTTVKATTTLAPTTTAEAPTTTVKATTTLAPTTTVAPAVPLAWFQGTTVICTADDDNIVSFSDSFILRDRDTGENLSSFSGSSATLRISANGGQSGQSTATVSGSSVGFTVTLSAPAPHQKFPYSLTIGGQSVALSDSGHLTFSNVCK